MFHVSETARIILLVFSIAALGYVLGRVRIKGVSLGTAGIFLIGLVFGHFGVDLPGILQTIGLVLFITAVGFSAGPGFLQRIKRNGLQYAALCITTAFAGSLVCLAIVRLGNMDAPLAVGIMTGAFTTSPGFAAAKDAAGGAAERVAAGYGLVYPVGVISKVLLIQLIPRLLRADIDYERSLIALPPQEEPKSIIPLFRVDKLGLFAFSLAAVLGVLLGSVSIALPGGGRFSLGNTGGPLLMGLLFGYLGQVRRISLRVDKALISPIKELGLLLFFSCAGVEGGRGMVTILAEYGAIPLIYGFAFVAIPLSIGFVLFRYVLRLPLLNGLGSMTASMTCTPSLAVLTELAGTDDVATAYATTYPIALITLVLAVQFLVLL